MMSDPLVAAASASMTLMGLFVLLWVFMVVREEYVARKEDPAPEWGDTELGDIGEDIDREKRTCTGCGGTRCYDWKVRGRSCRINPTRAPETGRLMGKHGKYTVQKVPDNWWPNPATRFAKQRPHLWPLVAVHAKISLRRPMGTVLP